MSQSKRQPGVRSGPRRGQKVRTPDCRHCLFLNSLKDGGVPQSTVTALCERMWLNRARRGQILYTEGNGATHLYAIRSGRVKLVKVSAQGREHVTGVLGPGDLFGFEALFDEAYASGAEAMADSELCLASADQLRELVAEVPRIATDMARYLHVQLSLARERQVVATTAGASAKVAAYLYQALCSSADNGHNGNGRIVAEGLTLKDLGGILGLAHETVCRVLAELKTRGIVESLPSGVRILDAESLRVASGR